MGPGIRWFQFWRAGVCVDAEFGAGEEFRNRDAELQRHLELTYLLISHNLTLFQYVSDAIAVICLGKIIQFGGADEIFGKPLHPYTEALLSATPSLDPEPRRRRTTLEASVPDPVNPPPGCAFHPHCARAKDGCERLEPELVDGGSGHLLTCLI